MNSMIKQAALAGLTVALGNGCAMFEQPHQDKMYLEAYEQGGKQAVVSASAKSIVDGNGGIVKTYGYGAAGSGSAAQSLPTRQVISESKPMTMEQLQQSGLVISEDGVVTESYTAAEVEPQAAVTTAAVLPEPVVATEVYATPARDAGHYQAEPLATTPAASPYAPAFEAQPAMAEEPVFNPEGVTAVQANYTPAVSGSSGYFVQAGAFASEDNARRFAEKLKAAQSNPVQVFEDRSSGRLLFKTQIGPFASAEDAMVLDSTLRGLGVTKPGYLYR